MKITLTVKEVNPQFDHELAERKFDGKESVDNILYNWEDEFQISGDAKEFKVRNNESYQLQVEAGDEVKTFEIPSMTMVDAVLENSVTTCAFSRSLVKDTKKIVRPNGDIHFFVFLKGGKPIINPMTGIYIAEKDFPTELPVPDEEEQDIFKDEEE